MEIGWTELLVIGIVALIVIGPKDLPAMFRELGRFTSKLQRMGREFSRAMEQAAKETGVNDIAADLKAVTSPKSMGLDAVKSAADRFEKWDPLKPVVKAASPAAAATTTAAKTTAATMGAATLPAAGMTAAPATPGAATAAPVAPVTGVGPATAALADKVAARKAIAAEAAAKLRAVSAGAPPAVVAAAEPAPKKPGRVRKPTKPKGDA